MWNFLVPACLRQGRHRVSKRPQDPTGATHAATVMTGRPPKNAAGVLELVPASIKPRTNESVTRCRTKFWMSITSYFTRRWSRYWFNETNALHASRSSRAAWSQKDDVEREAPATDLLCHGHIVLVSRDQ